MGDETSDLMNLDLSLGPIPEPGDDLSNGRLSLEEYFSGVNRIRGRLGQREIHFPWQFNGTDRIRRTRRSENLIQFQDIVTRLERRRSFWNRARNLPEIARANDSELMNVPLIARNDSRELVSNPLADPSSNFMSGEASVTPAERDIELMKVAEKNNEITVEDEKLKEKGNEQKGEDIDTGTFFDCNICFDLAKDPVVTICGHLFCWPCVYQWLHIHSVANECPVCKGEVNMKNLIPIYGRGNIPCLPELDPLGVKIPVRPHAPRVEGVRQSIRRGSLSFSMDELVRRLSERRVGAWRDLVPAGADEPLSGDTSSERMASRERMISYFLGREGREELPPPLDDRDSVSSIAAIIQSESQTIDTVLEIDSNVSLSTSTSRRRNANETSRASDVDSGDSRARRRRRIN